MVGPRSDLTSSGICSLAWMSPSARVAELRTKPLGSWSSLTDSGDGSLACIAPNAWLAAARTQQRTIREVQFDVLPLGCSSRLPLV
jgi:hypothetical protein